VDTHDGVGDDDLAVVAEEVRNLAAGSATAARDTQNLIDKALGNSDDGIKVVEEMAGCLQGIVDDITDSSATITQVSHGIGGTCRYIRTLRDPQGSLDERIALHMSQLPR